MNKDKMILNKDKEKVIIFCDGGCTSNKLHADNVGAWAYMVYMDGEFHANSGYIITTTSNRMELVALEKALEYVYSKEKFRRIHIFSDSLYLVNSIRNKWYRKWQKNNWRTSMNKPVSNKEIWKPILEKKRWYIVECTHIHAHQIIYKETLDKQYDRFVWFNHDTHFDKYTFVDIARYNSFVDRMVTNELLAFSSTRRHLVVPFEELMAQFIFREKSAGFVSLKSLLGDHPHKETDDLPCPPFGEWEEGNLSFN